MTWNHIQWKLRKAMFYCRLKLYGPIEPDISIFCNNCIGAFIAHDLGLPFNSPTVNLMIPPHDFIEYISNLDKYINAKIEPIKYEATYPVALLGGKVHIHFIHYKTIEDATNAWKRREARINIKKSFFILVETDGCTYEDLIRFNNLPYLNKIALTHKQYPKIDCSHYIKGYENKSGVIDAYRFHKILPLRKYDQYNWLKFFKH